MMQETLGARIAYLRKQKNLTQEALAEKMGVSPQAVSKWENDQSCPDIQLLPGLARLLDVSVDALLSGEKDPEVRMVPAEKRKKIEEMMLRIYVLDEDKETVRVSMPLMLFKIMLESGMQPDVIFSGGGSGVNADVMRNIDLNRLFAMAESGLIGTLMEVETEDTTVRIVVE